MPATFVRAYDGVIVELRAVPADMYSPTLMAQTYGKCQMAMVRHTDSGQLLEYCVPRKNRKGRVLHTGMSFAIGRNRDHGPVQTFFFIDGQPWGWITEDCLLVWP
jgi:hypothetical protein